MASTAPNGSSRGMQAATQSPEKGDPRPNPAEMMAHPVKTVRFVNALRRDKRISWVRKALYVAPIVALLIALLLPEGVVAAAVAVVLPFIGPAIDLPADAVVDWIFVGLAAYGLLGILPRVIVAEHHQRIFHKGRTADHS
jgi:hypothetical protein